MYVWRCGKWINKFTNDPMKLPKGNVICAPVMRGDIPAYTSPIDDHWVDGRREQREDLKRNDCVLSERPRMKFDREEYADRKARQAKELEKRRLG